MNVEQIRAEYIDEPDPDVVVQAPRHRLGEIADHRHAARVARAVGHEQRGHDASGSVAVKPSGR